MNPLTLKKVKITGTVYLELETGWEDDPDAPMSNFLIRREFEDMIAEALSIYAKKAAITVEASGVTLTEVEQ